jgi:hypothetical protein
MYFPAIRRGKQGERIEVDTVVTHPALARAEKTAKENGKQTGKSRVQLDLQPRTMAMLNELKEKTDSASYAEVFKNAMKLYDGIITEIERGNTFLIRDSDGKVSEFRMFL